MEEIGQILSMTDWGIAALLFGVGIAAFVLSTVSGGGGALVLVPVLNWLIGVSNTAPVLNLGTLIGRPSRLIIFWNDIDWKVCLAYAPPAIAGALLGGWLFSSVKENWLQIFIGLFLISTIFQFRFGKKKKSFEMQLWYFVPLGLIVSLVGTISGAVGPVLNPFYLNYGLQKEALIATKTASSFLMGIAQIGSYTFFGLLSDQYWIYGICLGIGATAGNLIGKKLLADMKNEVFLRWAIALMVISGVVMIVRQIS